MTLLELRYPNRCYDCLSVIPLDDLLCPKCQQVYADERVRRAGQEPSGSEKA